jgi:hypothetical protein
MLIGNGGVACSVGEVAVLGLAYLHGDLRNRGVGSDPQLLTWWLASHMGACVDSTT